MGRSRWVGWVALVAWVFVGGCNAGDGASGRVSGIAAAPCAPPSGFGFTNYGTLGAGVACASAGRDNAGAGLPSFEVDSGLATTRARTTDAGWFRGDEINLVPSNFTPPREAAEAMAEEGARPEARPTTWKRSALVPNTSKLSVGDEEDLPLEAMDVSVDIDGFRARVVLDLFYRNTKKQQLEGAFSLRLPDGASPHYVAFGQTKLEQPAFTGQVASTIADIRTQRAETYETVKEARMVPREQAAHAYTETVRQKTDPALLEWSGTGVFSARVFPLEPGKLHRIVVGYDVDLVPTGSAFHYRLDLPAGVPELEVDLSVAGGEARVEPAAEKQEGRYHWRNPETRAISAHLVAAGGIVLRGEDPGTGPHFAAQLQPALPAAEGAAKSRAVFLVDVSLSANPDHFNVWRDLLEAILEKNRPDLREFAVGFFHVETSWWREGFQPNTPGNVRAALDYANGLALEGATDLGQALQAASSLGGEYDVFLLGDGAPTWGEDDLHALSRRLARGHALFAYASGIQGTDGRTLGHLARESGGAVFSVPMRFDVAAVARAHRMRPWLLKGISVAGCSDLLLAGRPTSLYPGQVLRLVGRGRPRPDEPVILTLEQEGVRRDVQVPLGRFLDSPLAARAYGEVAVAQIEDLGEARDVARAYATHYRIVGRTCSLLMLESEEEYARYGIKPDEDALLVTKQPAARVVADTLREIGASLGDPKRRLLRWVERLERLEAVQIGLPGAVKLALHEMPVEAFRVTPEALRTRVREAEDVPAAFREALARRDFSYDSVTAEAERRRKRHGAADGLKALSSLVEHQPGDLVLVRDAAFTAMAWGLGGQAYGLLRRVAERRPWQSPTYHAIAQCHDDMGRTDLALVFYELALAADDGSQRYGDLKLIASFDYLRMLRRIERGELRTSVPDLARARLRTLAEGPRVKEADLVLIMAWNTDRTDVDLHVTDPRDEECYYQHRDTKIGGHLTSDVTGGFGPEMFVLKSAVPGEYVAEAHYYSSDDATRTSARSKVYVTIYKDWGRPGEQVTRGTVTLGKTGDRQRIALIRR